MKEKDILPVWNLGKFFAGIDDPSINETKLVLRQSIVELNQLKSHIPKMKDYDLLSFIRKYEQIVEKAHNLMNFASLNLCTQRDNKDAQIFEKRTAEFVLNIFEQISWVHDDLYNISIEKKYELLQSQKFKDYQEWFGGITALKAPIWCRITTRLTWQKNSSIFTKNTICASILMNCIPADTGRAARRFI